MIQVREVSHGYGSSSGLVIEGISFSLAKGECCALVGPSGSGKSTLARIIAGHLIPTSGSVIVANRSVIGRPDRDVLIIHQDWDLFPWQTVERQILFAMPVPDREKLRECIALAKLTGHEKRYPFELSGGMKRRLALARALAVSPKLLILDETFGFLDRPLRREIALDMRDLWTRLGTTVLLIAHDLDGLESIVQRQLQFSATHPARLRIASEVDDTKLLSVKES